MAKRNKIIEGVGFKIALLAKLSKRNDVVNIQFAAKLIFMLSATLAFMAIDFAALGTLGFPVGATIFLFATYPVNVMIASVPYGIAFVRTKLSALFHFLDFKGFPAVGANLGDKLGLYGFVIAGQRTKSSISLDALGYLEDFSTHDTCKGFEFLLWLLSSFVRTGTRTEFTSFVGIGKGRATLMASKGVHRFSYTESTYCSTEWESRTVGVTGGSIWFMRPNLSHTSILP